ncbi:MAG TPA: hypothetical protein VFS97_04125 [Nitrososphaeraceae archaeon]|nr:hypothetical protein [Nitrososphaeraceae archaeon]
MLVDVVVSKGEILAAKPVSDMAAPIIMVELIDGVIIPSIKWNTATCDTLNQRLSNRTFGRLLGKAMERAIQVVMENGELSISGEYGSIEIDDSDFEIDLELQNSLSSSTANSPRRI